MIVLRGIYMATIHFNSECDDDVRRRHLYEGHIFVFAPRPSSVALCQFADQLIRDAFGDLSPEKAQYKFAVEEYAAILSRLKPKFINHPKAKECIRAILDDIGCSLEKTYFDVPRMRTSTSDGYLTAGIAYAWHPHRDTWYSAPQCQINWWMPIYALQANNGVAFHPRYWSNPIKNDSRRYNYYEWNKIYRPSAAQFLKEDTRPLPRPTEAVDFGQQVHPVCPVGGIIMFAGAQLHSSVPNNSGMTRFSIDFRTVNYDDLVARIGAPNIDSQCTGTSLRDFLRASDLAQLSEEVVSLYDDDSASAGTGELVYTPREQA
jgi:hypothetical protein